MVIERAVHMCLPAAYISRTVQQNQSKGARSHRGTCEPSIAKPQMQQSPHLAGFVVFGLVEPGPFERAGQYPGYIGSDAVVILLGYTWGYTLTGPVCISGVAISPNQPSSRDLFCLLPSAQFSSSLGWSCYQPYRGCLLLGGTSSSCQQPRVDR